MASNSNPWPPAAFQRELILPFSHALVVRNDDDAIVAFLIVWVVRGELHILNLAVDPAHRRQGIATLLMEQTLELARTTLGESIFLEVRTSNVAAQALYRRFGFEQIGVRKKYYDDNEEDALVMSLQLAPQAAQG